MKVKIERLPDNTTDFSFVCKNNFEDAYRHNKSRAINPALITNNDLIFSAIMWNEIQN